MAKVLNLNRARKKRAREDAQTRADQNAAQHGRTRAEKRAAHLQQQAREAALDGARREVGPAPGGEGPKPEPDSTE